jgi:hypothetical protein
VRQVDRAEAAPAQLSADLESAQRSTRSQRSRRGSEGDKGGRSLLAARPDFFQQPQAGLGAVQTGPVLLGDLGRGLLSDVEWSALQGFIECRQQIGQVSLGVLTTISLAGTHTDS